MTHFFLYFIVNISSAAHKQHNDDISDLQHTPLTCKWSKSVGCLFTCFPVIIVIIHKALTVIRCQIGLIFTWKGSALCWSKWSDNMHSDNASHWSLFTTLESSCSLYCAVYISSVIAPPPSPHERKKTMQENSKMCIDGYVFVIFSSKKVDLSK